MRRQAVFTFISRKRRRATRRAIFASSTSSHTMSVRSNDPDTTSPFGRAATHRTCARRVEARRRRAVSTGRRRRAPLACPRNVWRQAPVDASHTLSVPSPDPDTMRPFGMTATHMTCARRGVDDVDEQSTRGSTRRRRRASLACPRNVWRHCSLDGSHTLSVPSPDPDTTRPFDRAATQLTCAPDCSDALFDRTRAPRVVRVPVQRRHAPVARLGRHGCAFSLLHTVVSDDNLDGMEGHDPT